MAITAADIDDMLAFLATHPEYQERFRPLVIGKEFQGLPGRLEAHIRDNQMQHAETNARLDRIEAIVEKLSVALDSQGNRLDAQGRRLDRIDGRLGHLEGRDLEARYARNLTNWFGRFLNKPRSTDVQSLDLANDAVERGEIAPVEWDRLRDLDFIIAGQDKQTGEAALLAAEVSNTIFMEDVERAVARASTLRRAGYAVRPLVGGYAIDDSARESARENGVIVDIRQP